MRTLKALVITAVLGALCVPLAAGADSAVRANIPFEFVVGGSILPAGHYQFGTQNHPRALVVESLDQQARVMLLAKPAYTGAGAHAVSRVVFNKYGDRYFLAEVWNAASDQGTRLIKSRQEREAALKASANTVVVASR